MSETLSPALKSLFYNKHCREVTTGYPDKYFDLGIVDPPYGINATKMNMGSNPTRSRNDGYGSGPGISTTVKLKGRLNQGSGKLKNRILNTSLIDWDNEIPGEDYFAELFRVTKNQIIWGGNYFPLPPTRGIICWDKRQPWENFSQFELAWTSFDCPAKLFSYSNTGGANREKKIHPTQKPVALYDFCFKHFAKKGLKVLDTHVGSGSSRISAHKAGLEYVGCEINPITFQDSQQRYDQFISQLTFNYE